MGVGPGRETQSAGARSTDQPSNDGRWWLLCSVGPSVGHRGTVSVRPSLNLAPRSKLARKKEFLEDALVILFSVCLFSVRTKPRTRTRR